MDYSGFTATERRILNLLADGMPHRTNELLDCLNDELGTMNTVRVHVCAIRKKLRILGHDLVCEVNHRSTYYRQVRQLLDNGYRG